MWKNTDPRMTYSSGSIVVCDADRDPYIASFDGDHDMCWYIIIPNHRYEKYRIISPGSETEEWPKGWFWTPVPSENITEFKHE